MFFADFSKAILTGADLRGLQLAVGDLHGANLEGACLWGARLDSIHLEGVNFKGADLREANLVGALIDGKTNFDLTNLADARGSAKHSALPSSVGATITDTDHLGFSTEYWGSSGAIVVPSGFTPVGGAGAVCHGD